MRSLELAMLLIGVSVLSAGCSASGAVHDGTSAGASSGATATAGTNTGTSSGTSGATTSATSGSATGSTAGASSSTTSGSLPSTPMGEAAAARLLMQGTFGATIDDINATAAESYAQWFAAQQAATPSLAYAQQPPDSSNSPNWLQVWLKDAVNGPDQLRQRMAFALSEIFVISNTSGPLTYWNDGMTYYYDILASGAFGNFRDLLENVTLSPEMGLYLSMMDNDKPNLDAGIHADENYAREIMQLFTVGLVMLNADGTPQLDDGGVPLPTYQQVDVTNLANVFTGWGSTPNDHPYGEQAWQYDQNPYATMIAYECTGTEQTPCVDHHDTDAKTILGGVSVPAGGTAAADLKIALDTLFNHPNVGPFIGQQLIERFVTSNPSPAYVGRVAAVFNNNGQGVRGDLFATLQAVLTDPEAITAPANDTGKLREPFLRLTNVWRAFNAGRDNQTFAEFQITSQAMPNFDEAPLEAPTVFNFFRPDYAISGTGPAAGLIAPEFQITNEYTLITSENQLQEEDYQFVDSQNNPATFAAGGNTNATPGSNVFITTAAWEPYADDPATLVNNLSLVFMQGNMPAAMQQTLTDYITAMPDGGTVNGVLAASSRVIESMDLVVNSPQGAVQR